MRPKMRQKLYKNFIPFVLLLCIMVMIPIACSSDISPRYVSAPTSKPSPTPTPTVARDSSGFPSDKPLVTQEDCHALGTVWVAIPLDNAVPKCGEVIASFTCDKTTVLATFYTNSSQSILKSDLTKEIEIYEADGFKLNDCGKESDSKYRLHWYKTDKSGGTFYETTDIDVP